MKKIIAFTVVLFGLLIFAGCGGKGHSDGKELPAGSGYVPGFGELMLNIQIHHAKLWFAGKNGDWELAAYNQSLIASAFVKIRTWHPGNSAAAMTTMINIPMDSVGQAIARKDEAAFQSNFRFLTLTCNNCHIASRHGYNVITIPLTEPIGNQFY